MNRQVLATYTPLLIARYRYSPVSALYNFDWPPVAAFQKARSNISERNHTRIGLTPMQLVDETREYLLEDLMYGQSVAAYGYVRASEPAAREAPRQPGGEIARHWVNEGG